MKLIINLDNIHKGEVDQLKDYLEANSWDWVVGKNEKFPKNLREYLQDKDWFWMEKESLKENDNIVKVFGIPDGSKFSKLKPLIDCFDPTYIDNEKNGENIYSTEILYSIHQSLMEHGGGSELVESFTEELDKQDCSYFRFFS